MWTIATIVLLILGGTFVYALIEYRRVQKTYKK